MKLKLFYYILLSIIILLSFVSCSKKNNNDIIQENNKVDNYLNKTDISATPIVTEENYLILESELQKNLETICIEPRVYGSVGENNAMSKIINQLKDYGYDTETQEFSVYKQTFDTTISILGVDYFNLNPYDSEVLANSKNIIATKYAESPTTKTFYITAHYDTINNTNGIIDNGSGLISVLQIAKAMVNVSLNFNIKFIFFSAEEYHRQGSRYYLYNLSSEERKNSIGCINIDMIGEKNAGEIVVKTFSKRTNLILLLLDEFTSYKCEDGGYSDDLSFYNAQIPVISFCNINPNLKRDIILEIDYLQIKTFTEELCHFIEYLSKKDLDNKLKEPLTVTDNDLNTNLINYSNLEIIDVTKSFIGNGHETLTTYNCKYNDKEIKIEEQMNLEISLSESINYQKLIVKENTDIIYLNDPWGYQINKLNDEHIKFNYIAGTRRGIIEGDITENEALSILKEYYKNYHTN